MLSYANSAEDARGRIALPARSDVHILPQIEDKTRAGYGRHRSHAFVSTIWTIQRSSGRNTLDAHHEAERYVRRRTQGQSISPSRFASSLPSARLALGGYWQSL